MFPCDFAVFKEHNHYTVFHLKLAPHLPALFVQPRKSSPPYPTFFFLHYYRGSKENILPLAQELVRNGFAALAIDMEYHGERQQQGKDILSCDLNDDLLAFKRTLEDSLCALRFLENHHEIDTSRLYFLGVSLGAILGVTVCSTYQHFQKAIFIVGGGNLKTLVEESMLDSIIKIRYHLLKEQIPLQEALIDFAPFEPLSSIKLISGAPLLFLNATHDDIVPRGCTFDLYNTASSPKQIRWFPAGHGLLFSPTFRIPRKIVEFVLEKY
ncbi:MAG: alpha/beta hydrolase [Candidatus Caldatribacterium sp.]|nr:alpha/beta hydrolase [Candidatus Caldatribacterium sp.]